MLYQARSRLTGPDEHELVIRNQNDPVWIFELREQDLDGTLRHPDLSESDVVFVIRQPDKNVKKCPSLPAVIAGEGVVKVQGYSDHFTQGDKWQLDVIKDGIRTTYAYGQILKKDII